MVSKKGGCQMLDGVNFRCIHDGLFVGAGHTDVKGGDGFHTDFILTGHINTGLQLYMVNRETRNFFHFASSVQ